MIKKLTTHEIDLTDSNVYLFSPNFEERSLGGFEDLLKNKIFNKLSGVFVITLQAIKPKEILDEIKSANTQRIVKELITKEINHSSVEIKYPVYDYVRFFHEIIEFCKNVSNEINLYIDISSLPRNIIFRFFDYLFQNIDGEKIVVDKLTIKSLNFLYTPAASYPETINLDLLGSIIGMYTEQPFHQLIREYDTADLFLFLSGNAHDAAQTYSLTTENKITSNINRHILIYLDENNLLFSYKKMAENIGVMNRSNIGADNKYYLFSYEHIGHVLFDKIQELFKGRNAIRSLVVLGAFGPKPISLCSYLAKVRYEFLMDKHEKSFKADVLTNDSAQYTSIYSHGKKSSQIYNIQFELIFSEIELNITK
jgi:hypothetical protein